MLTEILIGILCLLVLIAIILIVVFRPQTSNEIKTLFGKIEELQSGLKEDFRSNREENSTVAKDNRLELNSTLRDFKLEMADTLKRITELNQKALEQINKTLEEKVRTY